MRLIQKLDGYSEHVLPCPLHFAFLSLLILKPFLLVLCIALAMLQPILFLAVPWNVFQNTWNISEFSHSSCIGIDSAYWSCVVFQCHLSWRSFVVPGCGPFDFFWEVPRHMYVKPCATVEGGVSILSNIIRVSISSILWTGNFCA